VRTGNLLKLSRPRAQPFDYDVKNRHENERHQRRKDKAAENAASHRHRWLVPGLRRKDKNGNGGLLEKRRG